MLFTLPDILISTVTDPVAGSRHIRWEMARFDLIHPVVSGNKLFKLQHFISRALQDGKKRIITFGGAYSNHLVATAYACQLAGLHSRGIVRGEEPAVWSHTLQQCRAYGMELIFVTREQYKLLSNEPYPSGEHVSGSEDLIIPEGGYHPEGAEGAKQMAAYITHSSCTHIGLAVGTATTLAGILTGKPEGIKVIAVPVMKNMQDIPIRLHELTGRTDLKPDILNGYDFGGYAKKDSTLISFMNDLYLRDGIPTDFVYTAKMMYAVQQEIVKGFFPEGSHILCLHTGGLQGNLSLPTGMLNF